MKPFDCRVLTGKDGDTFEKKLGFFLGQGYMLRSAGLDGETWWAVMTKEEPSC